MSRDVSVFIAATLLAPSACAKSSKEVESPADLAVSESPTEEGLVEQLVDLDRDGTVDIRNLFRDRADAPRLLVKKELDLNRDGKFDVVSHFDDAGALHREEMDSDYDGKFDWVDHYKDGVRVMSEYDTDYDGQPNMFKYYIQASDGSVYLDRKERDEDGDGQIDLWERFSETGEVVRAGRDTDGDGKVDERLE